MACVACRKSDSYTWSAAERVEDETNSPRVCNMREQREPMERAIESPRSGRKRVAQGDGEAGALGLVI